MFNPKEGTKSQKEDKTTFFLPQNNLCTKKDKQMVYCWQEKGAKLKLKENQNNKS